MKARRTTKAEKKLNDITYAAILDERRAEARAREEERLAKLEDLSPDCARNFERADGDKVVKVRCRHKLNRHDPCSQCGCPGFVAKNGTETLEASVALMLAHPELFPQRKEG